jgi:hypothetical protein
LEIEDLKRERRAASTRPAVVYTCVPDTAVHRSSARKSHLLGRVTLLLTGLELFRLGLHEMPERGDLVLKSGF